MSLYDANVSDKERLKKAEEYFNQGYLDQAEPLLISLAKNSPHLAPPFYMLGTIYYEKGKFKRAISCYKKSLEIDPQLTDSAIGLSVVLNDLGRYEQAQEVFLTAQSYIKSEKKLVGSQIENKIAELHLELSRLYLDNKSPDKAMDNIMNYERCLGGVTRVSLKEKLNIFHSTSSFKSACYELEKYIKENDQVEPEVFMWLSENQYLNRQPLAASQTCERTIRMFPDYEKAKSFLEKLKHTIFSLNSQNKNINENIVLKTNKGDSPYEKLL